MNGYFLYFIILSFLGILIISLPVLVLALWAWRKGGAWRRAIMNSIGLVSLFMGLLLFGGALLGGQILLSLVFLAIAIGGAYLAYYPYKHMTNLVARPAAGKDVFYDEKGLYYDTRGKPYLFKWDEIKEYRILSVTEIDMNPKSLSLLMFPIGRLPISLGRYIAWRKIDPEYASTGIMKIGTVQFVKKDGSSVVLTHVLNPYRLIPIFDEYIKESNQKKSITCDMFFFYITSFIRRYSICRCSLWCGCLGYYDLRCRRLS
jgi:hypothetical protein